MFEKVDMYIVKCDCCGVNAFEETEFSGWECQDTAWEMATQEEWADIDGKHICFNCWDWDGDNQIIKQKVDTGTKTTDKEA